MKNIKKTFILMMCLLLVFLLVAGNEKVTAAGRDVTNTITDKGKMKNLIYEFRDLLGDYVCES